MVEFGAFFRLYSGIAALNDQRHFTSPVFLGQIFQVLKSSFDAIFDWVEKVSNDVELSQRAKFLLNEYFLPFMNRCFHTVFSYDLCFKPHFKNLMSYEDYVSASSFEIKINLVGAL